MTQSSEELLAQPTIEQIWDLGDLIRDAEVDTPHGRRSVGYYLSVGIDCFGHPHDRNQALLNAAAAAVLRSLATKDSADGE